MPYELRVDQTKNRMYLTLIGAFTDAEVPEVAARCIEALSSLKPGFTIVTDISRCQPLSQFGVQEVRRVAEIGLKKYGMRTTARVVGASAIAKLQFRRVNREAGFESYFATSVAEADALLDESE